jgi:hypothetical protein
LRRPPPRPVPAALLRAKVIGLTLGPVLALGLLAVHAPGCSTSNASAVADAGFADAAIVGVKDAPPGFDAGLDAATLHTSLRLALLAPLSYGVDVCLKQNGGVYAGPLLYELPSLPDAGADARRDTGAEPTNKDGSVTPSDSANDGENLDAPTSDGEVTDASADGPGSHDATVPHDATTDASSDATRDVDGADHSVDGGLDASSRPDSGVRVGGVPPGYVSSYLTVAGAGTFDVAIVVGGASSCTTPAPLAVQRITLDAGKLSTLIVLGPGASSRLDAGPVEGKDGGLVADADASRQEAATDAAAPSLSIIVLTDEPAVSTTTTRARFFNATSSSDAAPGPLSVAAVEQAMVIPLTNEVLVDAVGSQHHANPAVDSLGYWSGAPLVSATPIGLRVTTGTDAGSNPVDAGDASSAPRTSWTFASNSSFDLVAPSTNHTGFIVGDPGDPDVGLSLLWCDDTSSASVLNESCTRVLAP